MHGLDTRSEPAAAPVHSTAPVQRGENDDSRWIAACGRALFCLGLLLTAGCGKSPADRFHPAVAAIRQAGGTVRSSAVAGGGVSREVDFIGVNIGTEQLRPLREFDHLHTLRLIHVPLGNEAMTHLRSLTSLRSLYLSDTEIDDAGLARLSSLIHLERLYLKDSDIDGSGLAALARLSQLKYLNLSGTQVTDDALKHLAELPRLEHLGLENTQITNRGLVHLGKLIHLRKLYLNGTEIDGKALVALSHLPNLQSLSLSRMDLGDHDLAGLLALPPSLIELDLGGTAVTDAGLKTIASLKSLKLVNLGQCGVSKQGVKRLRKARPDLTISGVMAF